MRHRIATLLLIVLPLVVGSLGSGQLVMYLSDNGATMDPLYAFLSTIFGFSTGIINTWSLILKSENAEADKK